MTSDLPNKLLIGFSHVLRGEGFLASTDQSISFLSAIKALGPKSLTDIRRAARAIFAPTPERRDIFEKLFDQYFLGQITAQKVENATNEEAAEQPIDTLEGQSEDSSDPGVQASAEEATSKRAFIPIDDTAALKNFRRLAVKSLPERLTRRTRSSRHGRGIDRIRTVKAASKTGGELLKLLHRKRQLKLRPILLLIDVSGSMKSNTENALRFAHVLLSLPTRIEVFSLGTELTRVTPALKLRAQTQAFTKISELVNDFDGGTNLGETLSALLHNPRYAGFARGAIVISISDGLEVGRSDALLGAARKLYSLAFAHIWLTPLAKTEDFSPQTEALMRIEPFIDEFGSALSISHICAHLLGAPIPKEVA
ncbi:VWA domain-containing protein [Rhodobacteraceae bacterium Araon29]